MFIIDTHLDLSYNVMEGRDVLLPARQQTGGHKQIPTVGLPDLTEGGVCLVGGAIFCQPDIPENPGYTTIDEAHAMGQRQLRWYHQQAQDDVLNLITTAATLPSPDDSLASLNAILLLEGADPIRTPAEVPMWYDLGIRIVGLAWKATRYAGGTGAPGPLTAAGIELVHVLDDFGIIHDTSHLAEQSFWDLFDASDGPAMASHSNCRAIVPTDRQLSDAMIRALASRGGVIGINFFDKFLIPPPEQGKRRANLADVVTHMKHVCDLLGNANHVGLGTDMDGGLGREEIPVEIETSADLPRVADALAAANFPDADIARIMGGNWLEFFRRNLPSAGGTR